MKIEVHNMEEGREKALHHLPNLSKRIENFLISCLESEPCQNDGGCIIMSNSRMMCSPCRLRLGFFHTVYNAGAYIPELDEE